MREIIKKSIDHYNSTGDISHLVDVVRILDWHCSGPFEKWLRAELPEIIKSARMVVRTLMIDSTNNIT